MTDKNSPAPLAKSGFSYIFPLNTFIVALVLVLFAWYLFDASLRARAQTVYADRTEEISERIVKRLHDHEQVLRGAAGLFSVKYPVTRTDWRHYVTALQLDENHPGILGVGFAQWLLPAERAINIRQIRAEGFPEYTIRPEGERPVYTSIIYLEPFTWRNQRAFGYDMYSEPVRRAAMDRARDDNAATVAAKIILVQETDKDKQSGMLMYVPVYRQGMLLDSVANRRKAFLGFVYSPIRMNDFVFGTLSKLPQDIAFDIHVAGGTSADTLMFSSRDAQKLSLPETYRPAFTSGLTTPAYGCSWQFTFKTLPGFDQELNRDKSYLLLCAGIIFSLLLSGMALLYGRNRAQALVHAEELLYLANSQLDSIVESSGDVIAMQDTTYRYISFNRAFSKEFRKIFGKELKRGDSMLTALEGLPDDLNRAKELWDRALGGEDFTITAQFGNTGLERNWYELHFSPVRGSDGQIVGAVHIVRNVTDRIQAEEVLRSSEERFRSLANAAPVLIWMAGTDKLCYWFNQVWLDFTGRTMAQESGNGWAEGVHPEDLERCLETYQTAFDSRHPFTMEYRLRRADGRYRWLLDTGTPIFIQGVFKGYVGSCVDISPLKEMEQELRKSNDRFRQLAEVFPETIFEATVDGTVTYVNQHGLEQFRYSEEESARGPNIFTLVVPEQRLKVQDRVRERLLGADNGYLEFKAVRADGTTFDALGISGPVYEDGVLMGVRGFVLDISRRKKVEDHLRKLSRAVEQSPVSIVITDLEATIEFVNPAFTELTGYTADEAIGQNPRVLNSGLTPPETFSEMWATVLAGKTWEGEFHNKSKAGREFWEHAVVSALRDESGAITHYLAVKEDITEKKQILEQLTIAKDQADAANRSKSEFLSNMSHEIRTPMNGVIGMAQLLAMGELSPEQREYVAALEMSGKTLLALINDILDLSKVEAGMLTLEPGDFSLVTCLHDIVRTQKSVVFKNNLTLRVDMAADIPAVVTGDQLRVKQIVVNLLSNAIKFTPRGGITLSARTVERHESSVLVEIAVADTGIGISSGALENIFRPFVQAENSTTRQFGGTGLGLSICRQLAELMGGSISVTSRPDAGSCFTLVLPFILPRPSAAAGEAGCSVTPAWDGPKLRLLFVEDTPVTIAFGTALFRKLGVDMVLAENGRDCLAALEQGSFDLVLMDIQMPVMNGEEALREIRAKEQGTRQHLPVIAMTAYSLRGDKERLLGDGFDGYVAKPMVIAELLAEMKRVLAGQGEQRSEDLFV